jgi:hypothetical protein
MRIRANGLRVAKNERRDLTEGPEKLDDKSWWLTPGTHTRARMW